ncbi:MAG: hypothetical protein ABEJ42_04745 [Halobacteriaceae archaeon]
MADPTELTFTVEGPEGETDTVTVPASLLDALGQGESHVETVASEALVTFVTRAHQLVHHAEDDADADLEAAEEALLDRFEERFGVTYAEATGHQH